MRDWSSVDPDHSATLFILREITCSKYLGILWAINQGRRLFWKRFRDWSKFTGSLGRVLDCVFFFEKKSLTPFFSLKKSLHPLFYFLLYFLPKPDLKYSWKSLNVFIVCIIRHNLYPRLALSHRKLSRLLIERGEGRDCIRQWTQLSHLTPTFTTWWPWDFHRNLDESFLTIKNDFFEITFWIFGSKKDSSKFLW